MSVGLHQLIHMSYDGESFKKNLIKLRVATVISLADANRPRDHISNLFYQRIFSSQPLRMESGGPFSQRNDLEEYRCCHLLQRSQAQQSNDLKNFNSG